MKKRRVILWEGLPTEIHSVARNRTEGILSQCCNGNYTLSQLVESCYLQGINDTMEMMMGRFPQLVDRMFGSITELPEFEVM